jgi:hypothetical protein
MLEYFFFVKKKMFLSPKYGQIPNILTFQSEFRAKVEKKSERFWRNGRRHIVLIIELGYKRD